MKSGEGTDMAQRRKKNKIFREMDEMIVSTTPSIEGKKIVEYKQIVFGEVIVGVNFVKDFAAGLTNIFGGRSSSYEQELIDARVNALREMEERARDLGANAVVGVDIDYEVLGANNGMLMVTASGTAVLIE
ncbi:putative heavy-metal-binding protein [anaerobic digester metagenome]